MKTTTRRTMTAGLTLALALTLGACGGDDANDSPGVDSTGVDSTGVESPTPAATPEATDDSTGDDATDDADDTADDADDTADASDDTSAGETTAAATGGAVTAAGLAAIEAAEAEAGDGGTAFGIDDQDDDGSWEVDVRVGDRTVEVTVDADGNVVSTDDEDDLDDDDRAGLDAATVTLAEAIETALAETGGVLDDAELDEEDGTHVWKVSVDGTDDGRDDVDVTVDVISGAVVSVD